MSRTQQSPPDPKGVIDAVHSGYGSKSRSSHSSHHTRPAPIAISHAEDQAAIQRHRAERAALEKKHTATAAEPTKAGPTADEVKLSGDSRKALSDARARIRKSDRNFNKSAKNKLSKTDSPIILLLAGIVLLILKLIKSGKNKSMLNELKRYRNNLIATNKFSTQIKTERKMVQNRRNKLAAKAGTNPTPAQQKQLNAFDEQLKSMDRQLQANQNGLGKIRDRVSEISLSADDKQAKAFMDRIKIRGEERAKATTDAEHDAVNTADENLLDDITAQAERDGRDIEAAYEESLRDNADATARSESPRPGSSVRDDEDEDDLVADTVKDTLQKQDANGAALRDDAERATADASASATSGMNMSPAP